VIADFNPATLDDPAADASTPLGREGSFKAPMRHLHQMAGLSLLDDFQHQFSDPQLATLARRCDALDQEIGSAGYPRQRNAKLTAGVIPSLTEKDRDLAARFSAAGVTFYALGDPHLRLIDFDQGRPKGRCAGYSQQNSHIFTSTKLKLVMNYTFMS
jgi:hypothetical protein